MPASRSSGVWPRAARSRRRSIAATRPSSSCGALTGAVRTCSCRSRAAMTPSILTTYDIRDGRAAAPVKLERIELFLIRLPLKFAYETSGSRETHQTRVIARLESGGVVGWGESVAPETPWYSGETPETVWWLLDEIAIPRLLAKELAYPTDTGAILGWIKDHRMAKATLEMAVWDLFAKAEGVPLAKMLGGTRDRILCGVAIGIQPTVEQLLDKIAMELHGGYQRVKVKIKPGWDAAIA